jgi:aspartyl-tRNA(Asn)/glutamyl-tRNA(Gln) amidotransferase subunit C
MEINKKLIIHVAKLARLELNDSEISEYEKDFKEILKVFSKIQKEKINEELAIHPIELNQVLRKDKTKKSISKKEAFKNSKEKESRFIGPKIK